MTEHVDIRPFVRGFQRSRPNAYTIIASETKASKLIGTLTVAISPEGKTQTLTRIGTDASGRPINNIMVYEKQ
jgi:hypothetical protein